MAQSNAFGVQTTDTCTLNAKSLISELKTVTDWYRLGFHLGLKTHQLKNIQQGYQESERRMLEMLDLWLRCRPNAAWGDVVSALQEMAENSMAESIRRKYIRDESKL